VSARARGVADALPLTAIVALGSGFRFWGLAWGLQNANVARRPHPDEWTIYWLFHWFDRTHSLNPCPSYPKQCFFDWGTGFPYLAYGLHFVFAPFFAALPADAFGPHADPAFVHAILAARIVSALASVATILVAYRLGSLAFGRIEALAAALLVALSGLLIQLAHFATPDSTTILLLSLSLLASLKVVERPSARRLVTAGIAVGAAAGTEYHMALLVVPLGVAWWLSGPRSIRLLLWAAGAAILSFLLLNAYLVVDWSGFTAAIGHTLRIRTVDSGLQYGDRWEAYGPAWLYVVRYPLGYGVGFAVAGWMILGVAWAAVRRSRTDLVLLSWIVPYFLLVTAEPAKFMRYSAPLLMPLALLAGRLAWDVLRTPRRAVRLTVAACAAGVIAFTASYDAAYAGLFASPDPRSVATTWVNGHAPAGATVAFEELPDGLLTMPYFLAPDLRACFLQQQRARLGEADYVVLDSYTREELQASGNSENQRLAAALAQSAAFRRVDVIDNQPTFLGVQFPIGASPHDWRYPSHEVTIYRRVAGAATGGKYCFEAHASGHPVRSTSTPTRRGRGRTRTDAGGAEPPPPRAHACRRSSRR
jgi:hypothetical protein